MSNLTRLQKYDLDDEGNTFESDITGWLYKADEVDAILAKLADGAEPVGEATLMAFGGGTTMCAFDGDKVPPGTKLYATTPDAQAQIDALQAELAKRDARIESLLPILEEADEWIGEYVSQMRSYQISDKASAFQDKLRAAIAQEQS